MPRILIAEDDPKSCEILRTTLANFGHEVVATNDGEEALAKTQHEAFDLVITDWKMPRIDGLELCQTLKRQQTSSPIIMLSTVKDPSEIQRGRRGH